MKTKTKLAVTTALTVCLLGGLALSSNWEDAVPPRFPSTTIQPVAVDKTLAEHVEPGGEVIYWPN